MCRVWLNTVEYYFFASYSVNALSILCGNEAGYTFIAAAIDDACPGVPAAWQRLRRDASFSYMVRRILEASHRVSVSRMPAVTDLWDFVPTAAATSISTMRLLCFVEKHVVVVLVPCLGNCM